MASSIYPNPWKILLTLLGTCVLSALVWIVGPHIQFGGSAPLASFMSRYLIAGGLLALWAIVTLYKVMSGRNESTSGGSGRSPDPGGKQQRNPELPQTVGHNAAQDAIQMAATVRLANFGYYGKTPIHAVSNDAPAEGSAEWSAAQMTHYNLPIAFTTSWHDWLSVLMDQGTAGYLEKWPSLYQQSPTYRFALSAGIAGDTGWAGILWPSLAADGDHFPLCFAATLPEGISAAEAPHRLDTWYASLERLVQRVSQTDYDFKQLQKHAQQFATSAACTVEIPSPRAATFDTGISGSEGSVSVRASASHALQAGTDQLPLVDALLTQTFYQYSVWATSPDGSTGGSDSVIASGLPTGTQGLALFSRDWAGSGCGNLLLTGTRDTQSQLEKPQFASTTRVNKLKAPKQAPVQRQDDDDITLLKRPGHELGSTGHKSD